MFNNANYFCKPGDLYIIHPYDPHHPHRPLILSDDQDLTFGLQKYRFDPAEQLYAPLFRREICFNFHIASYDTDHSDHNLLPARLSGHPRLPLPVTSSIDAHLDAFIRDLDEHSNLTIRYSPELHHGCLMHSHCKIDQIHHNQLRGIFSANSTSIFTKPPLPTNSSIANSSANSTPSL